MCRHPREATREPECGRRADGGRDWLRRTRSRRSRGRDAACALPRVGSCNHAEVTLLFLIAVFVCVFCVPGYACATLIGRPRRVFALETAASSVLLGLAVVTLVTYYLSLLIGFGLRAVLLGPIVVAAAGFILRGSRTAQDPAEHVSAPRLLW